MTASVIIGLFPFIQSHRVNMWVVGGFAHKAFINLTLLWRWPEVDQRWVFVYSCTCICVCTFSARASSKVPSAVSVFDVSVCKDLTLSFRPLSCFSLSRSWSWRFSICRKKHSSATIVLMHISLLNVGKNIFWQVYVLQVILTKNVTRKYTS